MNPTYYDVAALLNDGLPSLTLGFNLTGGEWLVTTDGVPFSDSQVLCLEGVGTPSPLAESYEQSSVQILVRGGQREADYITYRQAKQVGEFLLSQTSCVTINGTVYKGFEQGSNIAALGKDQNERFLYSMNFFTYRNATD